jgi:DNA-binding FadR family transcriptional regulator
MAAHDCFTCSDGRIELCSSRYRLLCEFVGATRESVSLVLGRLSGEGLVERHGSTLYVTPSARLFERLDDTGVSEDALLVGALADVEVAPALQ